ncbi:hypothetical protein LTR17_007009 [Elasticomyces elasticus]|nr:hypothetical protein LTR17_007009 [Elasticomyces elasticus]
MSSTIHVYVVERRDFDSHEFDAKETKEVISIHANIKSANAAAEDHMTEEAETADEEFGEEPEVSKNRDGGYEGFFATRSDERDHFEISVRKFRLDGDFPTQQAPKRTQAVAGLIPSAAHNAPPAKKQKQVEENDDDDAEDNEEGEGSEDEE